MVEGKKQEFVQQCQAAYMEAIEKLQTLSIWNKIDAPEGMFAFTAQGEGDVDSLKCEFYVNKPAAEIAPFLFQNWLALNKNYQPKVVNNERCAADFGENAYLYKESFNPPMVSAREAVVFHMTLATNGQHILIARSVDDGSSPPEGHVRAEIKYLVHQLTPTPDDANRTQVTVCFCNDPKGSIPGALKNKILKKRVKLYATIMPQLESLTLS